VSGSFGILALTAATIGALHTAAPDHWAPFVAVARARQWSFARTARVTALCGFGHVTVSALLGLIALLAGAEVMQDLGRSLESVAGILLIGFGLAYGLWGLRRSLGARLHGHRHSHYDHVHDPGTVTVWGLFLVFCADPCVAAIPIVMAAAPFGVLPALGVVLAYEAATIGTMLLLVLPARKGATFLRWPWLDQYGDAAAGGLIASVGIVVGLIGW
jgi:nickel/cobalt transporter (NicO) family protein